MSPGLITGIAQFLAVIACCFGGGLGGYVLARPEDALALVALRRDGDSLLGLTEARAFGGLMLLAHAGVAGTLGYAPSIGAVMAFTLALTWLGAAGGRILSMVVDRPETAAPDDLPPPATAVPTSPPIAAGGLFGGRWAANRGLLSLDLLMAAALALPLWMLLAPTLRHGGVQV